MSEWIILIVYLAGLVLTAWKAAPRITDSMAFRDEPDLGDRLFGAFIALSVAIVWPISALVLLLALTQRKGPKALAAEARRREARIAELEGELLSRRREDS